jgi:hypothetical protein
MAIHCLTRKALILGKYGSLRLTANIAALGCKPGKAGGRVSNVEARINQYHNKRTVTKRHTLRLHVALRVCFLRRREEAQGCFSEGHVQCSLLQISTHKLSHTNPFLPPSINLSLLSGVGSLDPLVLSCPALRIAHSRLTPHEITTNQHLQLPPPTTTPTPSPPPHQHPPWPTSLSRGRMNPRSSPQEPPRPCL